MPLYEFRCGTCHDQFELLLLGGEEPSCPQCASADLTKLLSVPAAHQKSGSSLPLSSSLPLAGPPPGGFCGRGLCGLPGCGDQG